MTTDWFNFLKVLESVLWSSPVKLEAESWNRKDNAWLSISLHKLPQLVKMSSCSEAQEIEKLRDISVYILGRKGLTLLLVLDAKAENGKEPEEEDDRLI